jgi:hypothetical protein
MEMCKYKHASFVTEFRNLEANVTKHVFATMASFTRFYHEYSADPNCGINNIAIYNGGSLRVERYHNNS